MADPRDDAYIGEVFGPVFVPGRQVPILSWTAQYPDQVAAALAPLEGQAIYPLQPPAAPALDFWQAVYPDQLDRPYTVIVTGGAAAPGEDTPPAVAGAPLTTVVFPEPTAHLAQSFSFVEAPAAAAVPDLWTALYPDQLEHRTPTHPAFFWSTFTPAVVAPDVWQAYYPDHLQPPARQYDAFSWSGFTPAVAPPDLWTVVYPDWLPPLTLAAGAIPSHFLPAPAPAPNGWSASYPDQIEHRRSSPSDPAYFSLYDPISNPFLFRRTLQHRVGGRTIPVKS